MTHPNHLNIYLDNIIEVENLLSIHEKVSGIGRGRKVDVEILNKSIIVLLVACWESFIEVIIEDAFTIMLNSARTHTIFPSSVLTKASKEIRSPKDDREIWKIAGDGWRQVLTDYKDNLLRNQIDYFHSPKANNIGELCENILGLKNITSHWS